MDQVIPAAPLASPLPKGTSVFDQKFGGQSSGPVAKIAPLVFGAIVLGGLAYAVLRLLSDLGDSHELGAAPFILLGIALLIALGFEFVNGFHDTANAVATVIYTHALPPQVAVVWSGFFNFLGVLTSSGAVAFGIISLLPVELILQVSSKAGFAMVFALLIAAIIWNLGTWALGLPASSSHTLIGSIIGVGIANSLNNGADGTSGVDWTKATEIGYALLLSPVFGFCCAAGLFLTMRYLVRKPALYSEPEGNKAPPLWIRGLLIFTCTGVSFAHGSNDGQKGMGLIMLILIGTVPTVYALNRAPDAPTTAQFVQLTVGVDAALARHAGPAANTPYVGDPRLAVTEYVRDKALLPDSVPALRQLVAEIAENVRRYPELRLLPDAIVPNVRNDMYLASEAFRLFAKTRQVTFAGEEARAVNAYRELLNGATRFIPDWVKVAVAIALGLGTMVGWKRIVVTVGEKIGKTHMSYGQGASAELVAMGTIFAADIYGLPVSTTHVLSSGVAGTMAASGSGLQMSTLRNLLMAWVLTLPCAILISGSLFFLFLQIF
ncbi:inorganic phosphate transporter [Plastoroseomonas arctica]|uniref:Phosphate transporter n=1 Tax=Plastoroseomonas arctica TaxID=1509237 RepID=A0AAF1JW35_9PROT|nr:inorganic phosphate transporter [Plastoroseomonas arctica]MBR0654437.1 inorganic phosphate transporter [Plastoroseomonas arctica]